MAQLAQPGAVETKTQEDAPYHYTIRKEKDSLYLMVKNTISKRAFDSTFSKAALKEMGLSQSLEQIINLFEIAKSGQKKATIQLKVKYGVNEDDNSDSSEDDDDEDTKQKVVQMDDLADEYTKGCAMYLFILVKETWLNKNYCFKLIEQERTETDILNDIIDDMKQEIHSLKQTIKTVQPLRVSFDGKSNVNGQTKECHLFKAHGISKVIRMSEGKYVIHFAKPMKDRNYCVHLTCNMWYTGGLIVGLEGNNKQNDQAYSQKLKDFRITTRCPRANANRDCDLVHAIVYP